MGPETGASHPSPKYWREFFSTSNRVNKRFNLGDQRGGKNHRVAYFVNTLKRRLNAVNIGHCID